MHQGHPSIIIHEAETPAYMIRRAGAGVVGVHTRRSPAKDTPNEDGALILDLGPACVVLAVADGCGGLPAGEAAALAALQAIRDTLAGRDDEDLAGAILEAFGEANRAVLGLRAGAGTTLALAEVRERSVRTYHAGDSAALLTGQRGRLRFRTIGHAPSEYAVEAGMLTPDEAIVHEDRHLITNLVGSDEMRVEVGPVVPMRTRDTLLLASDGLLDNLRVDEIVDLVRAGPIELALAGLGARAGARMLDPDPDGPGHADDLTIGIYRHTC
jgi:serine/threonine protein phosphatase PrpC